MTLWLAPGSHLGQQGILILGFTSGFAQRIFTVLKARASADFAEGVLPAALSNCLRWMSRAGIGPNK